MKSRTSDYDIRLVQTHSRRGQTDLKFMSNIHIVIIEQAKKPLLVSILKLHAIFIVLHSNLRSQTASREIYRCDIYVCLYADTLTREMTFENVIFLFIASGYKRRHVWMPQLT